LSRKFKLFSTLQRYIPFFKGDGLIWCRRDLKYRQKMEKKLLMITKPFNVNVRMYVSDKCCEGDFI